MKKRNLHKVFLKTILAVFAVWFLWGTVSTKTVEAAEAVSYGNVTYTSKITGTWGNYKTTIYSQKKGGSRKKLISLSGNINLSFAYGDYLCFEKEKDFEKIDFWKMNVKTLKRTRLSSGCFTFEENYGRYALISALSGNYRDREFYICNILTGKMKCFSKHCMNAHFSNKKLYYVECAHYSGISDMRVRCCSVSGSNPKYVTPVFRADGVYTAHLTSKYVEYSRHDKNYKVQWYRYTYATKKTKKIASPY